jgi:hypothetical protein
MRNMVKPRYNKKMHQNLRRLIKEAIATGATERAKQLADILKGSSLPSCSVYVIEAKDAGLVKVGISENIKDRLLALQEASPTNLSLYLHIEARDRYHAREIEQRAHAALAASRHHGEWFKVKPHIAAQAVRDSWTEPQSLADL